MNTPYVCAKAHALSVAKTLKKKVDGKSLSTCQDLVARMLGHESFAAMASNDSPPSFPDDLVEPAIAEERRILQTRVLVQAGIADAEAETLVRILRLTGSPGHPSPASGLPASMSASARHVSADGFLSMDTPFRRHDPRTYDTPTRRALVFETSVGGDAAATILLRQSTSEDGFDVQRFAVSFTEADGATVGFVTGCVFDPRWEWVADQELASTVDCLAACPGNFGGMMERSTQSLSEGSFVAVSYVERSMTRTSPGDGVAMLAAAISALVDVVPELGFEGYVVVALDTALPQHEVEALREPGLNEAREARKIQRAYLKGRQRLREALSGLGARYAKLRGEPEARADVASVYDSRMDGDDHYTRFPYDRRAVDRYVYSGPFRPEDTERLLPEMAFLRDETLYDVVKDAVRNRRPHVYAVMPHGIHHRSDEEMKTILIDADVIEPDAQDMVPTLFCRAFIVEKDGSIRGVLPSHPFSGERHYGLGNATQVDIVSVVLAKGRIVLALGFTHHVVDGRPVWPNSCTPRHLDPLPFAPSERNLWEAHALMRPSETPVVPSTVATVASLDQGARA